MLGRLIPRDDQFFELFDQLAAHLATTAKLLDTLFCDLPHASEHVKAIKDIEHKADLLTLTISQRIDKSFITPIDREDIHMLASRLDDVIDLLDGASRRFTMLHITDVLPPAKHLAGVLLRAANEIKLAVNQMRKPPAVNQHVALIKHLEEEGDAIYHDAVGALFAGSPNPLDVIKWKEMYDTLEHAIDSCMGVAQVLQSISLKNA
jgi:predicted phosphate transport protein (TIGR00153 family)